jgi:solute carrier family 25 protein 39/40
MVKKSGPIALWRGLPPTLYRDVPFSAIYWMGYEETKQALLDYDQDMNGLQASFLAGAFSGMVCKQWNEEDGIGHSLEVYY